MWVDCREMKKINYSNINRKTFRINIANVLGMLAFYPLMESNSVIYTKSFNHNLIRMNNNINVSPRMNIVIYPPKIIETLEII